LRQLKADVDSWETVLEREARRAARAEENIDRRALGLPRRQRSDSVSSRG
jgi:hypothetical protein